MRFISCVWIVHHNYRNIYKNSPIQKEGIVIEHRTKRRKSETPRHRLVICAVCVRARVLVFNIKPPFYVTFQCYRYSMLHQFSEAVTFDKSRIGALSQRIWYPETRQHRISQILDRDKHLDRLFGLFLNSSVSWLVTLEDHGQKQSNR